ncbi:DNA invertase Pin-like site-specific DNA recombinase [Defluviimonas denitrificans]|jgi:DNA invertase Pin-like site-specific DNA recombinase|uniref:DNA invertase Pin-like site-specific DNA recombinase n=1 Tax=Albidovulum denitrificans TaxID=404881 RepID=A0A2S8SAW9_9RHOB|nr:DNA invertase Pin-like site-specific DNA recombinase [Defluviimonas denitrificans]
MMKPPDKTKLVRKLRCAVYTRKSSEEGLEQEFNSLHAQREACEAYIASQRSEGWVLVRDQYDDGGISGGTLERPGLKRLLEDIEDGLVDVVVVYKIDRLSRSLADFAKLVEVFDRNGVTFVSVTQSFNTTTSMGRLTLNILLSFAQFEREVTAERIRDKVAASRKKGMWMGGVPPYGYRVEKRKLVVDEETAAHVRWIFARFLEIGSCTELAREVDNASINTKYNKEEVTTTNRLIRELLNIFHRSCYVGYTATPFANIFIDPDQDDEMLAEDLFPKDFIIGLDAPSNYFGGKKVFVEGLPDDEEPTWLRYVDDNEDVLPVKHPQDFVVEALPDSLVKAVRAFVLTAATLMQMGRWFGYRTGYEDLCRIWMPTEAIGWYAYIANATEELHSEIHEMAAVPTATPRDFGLAVRSHPASLLITARNKMGSGTKVTTLIGLSNKFVETSRVSIRSGDLSANIDAAKSLFLKLKGAGLEEERSSWGALYRGVPVQFIDEFLAVWRNAEQSVTTDPDPVRKYINARSADELQTWDVLVPSLTKGESDRTLPGRHEVRSDGRDPCRARTDPPSASRRPVGSRLWTKACP